MREALVLLKCLKMRVLVVGASGLLGRALVRAFGGAGHEVHGAAVSRTEKGNHLELDVLKYEQVEKVLESTKPDVVVYAAKESPAAVGELSVEKEPRSNPAGNLAAAAKSHGAWMLYVSCESVFSLEPCPSEPRTSDTPTSPDDNDQQGWYKALCERAVLAAGGDDVGVLRVPRLVGPLEKIGESDVTVLAKLVFPRIKVGGKVNHSVVRYPAHVRDVANVCVGLAEVRMKTSPLHGVWHFPCSAAGFTDWDVTQMIATILKVEVKEGADGLVVEKGNREEVKLDGSSLQDLFSAHGRTELCAEPPALEEDIKAILMALIPAAALRKDPSPLAAAADAAGVKVGVDARDLPVDKDGMVWIDRGDGKMVQTSKEAASLLQEANAMIVAGDMNGGMAKMKAAMKADPNLTAIDEESDKKCVQMVTQMLMSGSHELAETILLKYWEKKVDKVPADSYGNMSLVEAFVFMYKHTQKWDSMLTWAEKAKKIVKEHKGEDSSEMATALSNYGLACGPLGRYEEAEEAFNKAMRIHEVKMGSESMQVGQTCHNLALLFRNTNQKEKAEAQYERSRRVWVKEEQFPLLAVSFKDSAIMYRNAGDLDKAIDMIHKAQQATKKIKNFPPEQVEAQLQLTAFKKEIEDLMQAPK